MTKRSSMFSLLALVLLVGAQLAAGSEKEFDELLARAQRDMATEKGSDYDKVMGEHFASRHADGVKACVEQAGSSEPKAFQAVIVVAKSGKVSKVALKPETSLSNCVRQILASEAFPEPPFAPFHDLMEMEFE
jgi:hypothetical protein